MFYVVQFIFRFIMQPALGDCITCYAHPSVHLSVCLSLAYWKAVKRSDFEVRLPTSGVIGRAVLRSVVKVS